MPIAYCFVGSPPSKKRALRNVVLSDDSDVIMEEPRPSKLFDEYTWETIITHT